MSKPACRCSHSWYAHQHYRAGDDCALCDCPRWRRWFLSLWPRNGGRP